jgi:hypothetical protein
MITAIPNRAYSVAVLTTIVLSAVPVGPTRAEGRPAAGHSFSATSRFHTVALDGFMDGDFSSDLLFQPKGRLAKAETQIELKRIPFNITRDGQGRWRSVDVGPSGWREMDKDAANWNGAPWLSAKAPKDLVLSLPMHQYVRAYLLAVSDGREGREPALTLRCGVFQGRGYLRDVTTEVPTLVERKSKQAIDTVAGHAAIDGQEQSARLFVIPVDLPAGALIDLPALAPQMRGKLTYDIQLTRRTHVRVAAPDPFMFAQMPLGVPSGVRVFAVTLESSPVRMNVTARSTWNVFPDAMQPSFDLVLENTSAKPKKVELTARWLQKQMNAGGQQSWKFTLAAGDSKTITHDAECTAYGLFHYQVKLAGRGIDVPVTHQTTFARLPKFPKAWLTEDIRSRYCSWWWDGTHGTAGGGVGVEPAGWLGLGYVQHFGKIPPKLSGELKKRGIRDYHADAKLMWHEKYLSGPHLMHYPRMFLNGERYKFDEKEKVNVKYYFDETVRQCTKLRKEKPDTKILLGNSSFNFVEELLYRRLPSALFDAVGHEVPSFARMPERQPELAGFQTAWWYRQALDRYGYKEKPITGCAEGIYRSTNPGNLSWQEQADLYVRDIMHSLSYDYSRITPSCFEDVGTGYYYSNWGASGLFTRFPDVHPKLSYVAYAVAAHLTSDADFVRVVPTGSHSVFCLELSRRRGDRLFVAWTLRGKRQVTLRGIAGNPVSLIEQEGNRKTLELGLHSTGILPTEDSGTYGRVKFSISPSVVFIEGMKKCFYIKLDKPVYADPPAIKRTRLVSMDSLTDWTLKADTNPILDDSNFDYPRQKGSFEVKEANDPDQGRCLEFRYLKKGNRPPWIPSYQELRLKKSVRIEGRPTHAGMYVRGNSGWGRVLLSLEDAKGEPWLSIGQPDAWNAYDIESLSYLNFDGWRWIEIPLPGQYGSGYHWPRYCIWRNGMSDKTGDGIVDYPLSLTGLVLEQRDQIVYVNEMVPASRRPIRLGAISAVYGDPEKVGDWEGRNTGIEFRVGER